MHRARQHAASQTRERRHRLAHEAARLMAEGGIRDYHQAKLKAASRLGIHDDASLPRNTEIEDALREYQRLFSGPSTATNRSAAAKRAACAGVPARLRTALAGPVLEGTADTAPYSCTCTVTTRKPCTASWTSTAFPPNRGRADCGWTANGAWTCRCGCSAPKS